MKEYIVEMRVVKYAKYLVVASSEEEAEYLAESEAYIEHGDPSEAEVSVFSIEEYED